MIEVSTREREAFIDITDRINGIIHANSRASGACLVFCPHTTAAVTVNECADPAVVLDMKMALDDLVADVAPWEHVEGNSPAHVKASLMGSSVMVPIVDGELGLGRWQGLFFCEFDGPRTREVWVQVLS